MTEHDHTAQQLDEVTKTLGDLGAHDLGHVIKFEDREGVLTRVLHEGSTTGPRPTYLTIQVDGLTASYTGRHDHDVPVTVLPIAQRRRQIIDLELEPVEHQ